MRSLIVAFFAMFASALAAPVAAFAAGVPVRVVVVTTFAGEFADWDRRFGFAQTLAFPLGNRALRYDPARGVLLIQTGEGAERGAASIMALGTDPRFDCSKAYWIVAAIAGVDPNVASVGSAAWADYVVNADLAFELDPRDAPRSWQTGIVPFGRSAPFAAPAPPANSSDGQLAYRLNPTLVDWAYRTTARVPLGDDANLRKLRARYPATLPAARPPFVLRGATLSGDRYWIGAHMNAWAERWVRYWTGNRATFATTAEEDAGIFQSLTFLSAAKRADAGRVLVLRTASDYAAPPPGVPALAFLQSDASPTGESAAGEAFEAAYRVGSRVAIELATNWDRYATSVP